MQKASIVYTFIPHSGKTQMQEVQEINAEKCTHNLTTAIAIIRSLVLAGSQVLIFKMM